MQDYNFWADLLLTFKSSPDWIKALWLLVPPSFLLATIAMFLRFRLAMRRTETVGKEIVAPLLPGSGVALEPDEYFKLSDERETLLAMLPTPLCPVGHLPPS